MLIRKKSIRWHQLFLGPAVRYVAPNQKLCRFQMGQVIRLLVGVLMGPRGYHKIIHHMFNIHTALFSLNCYFNLPFYLLFIAIRLNWCLFLSTDKLTGSMWTLMHISYLSFYCISYLFLWYFSHPPIMGSWFKRCKGRLPSQHNLAEFTYPYVIGNKKDWN